MTKEEKNKMKEKQWVCPSCGNVQTIGINEKEVVCNYCYDKYEIVSKKKKAKNENK